MEVKKEGERGILPTRSDHRHAGKLGLSPSQSLFGFRDGLSDIFSLRLECVS